MGLITPPRSDAVLRLEPGSLERNRAIERVRFLGKANWKRSKHYGRRSLADAAMHRLKAAFGPSLRSRLWTTNRWRLSCVLISLTPGAHQNVSPIDRSILRDRIRIYATGPNRLADLPEARNPSQITEVEVQSPPCRVSALSEPLHLLEILVVVRRLREIGNKGPRVVGGLRRRTHR